MGVGKQANLAPLEEMHSPFGAVRHQRGGKKPPEVADRRNAYHAIWYSKVIP